MAYSTAIHGRESVGNLKVTYGLCTADGATGDLDTELGLCLALACTAVTAAKVINITSTLPIAGSAVGVGCETNSDFYFIALGV